MNTFKRATVMLLAMVMVLSTMSFTVFAADTYKLVIEQTTEGYTYVAYQLFTGEPSTKDGKTVLSNIEWGDGVLDSTKEQMYSYVSKQKGSTVDTAAGVAEWLASQDSAVFHNVMRQIGSNDGSALQNARTMPFSDSITKDDGTTTTGYVASGLESGYYLVKNTGVPEGASTTYSDYVVEVVGADTFAEPKYDATPTVTKKVSDINDSTNQGKLFANQDSADYDIGDTIPYVLTATLPTSYANYEGYRLVFVDNLSKGLTIDESSIKVYFNGTEPTLNENDKYIITQDSYEAPTGESSSTIIEPTYEGGTTFYYAFPDLKKETAVLAGGSTITIKYNAVLNSDAVVTSEGNPNTFHVNYTNNPTNINSISQSPEDINVVFTYKTVFNKVDPEGNALTGADFKLEKKFTTVTESNGTTTRTETWTDVTALHTGDGAVNPVKTGTSEGSTFTFSGLDDGVYRLTETTTPTGYNTMEPVEFTVTSEHEILSDNPALTKLTGTSDDNITLTSTLSDASLSSDIVNRAGFVLPTTGGIGTVIFYALGTLLVVGGAIFLISRKRLQK